MKSLVINKKINAPKPIELSQKNLTDCERVELILEKLSKLQLDLKDSAGQGFLNNAQGNLRSFLSWYKHHVASKKLLV